MILELNYIMKLIEHYLQEDIIATVPFIVHRHNARSANVHYDLRFLDAKNPKLLHSFACPDNFEDLVGKKNIPLIKTRDHDPRWLTLKSYRLETIDSGMVDVMISTSKFFRLVFHGTLLEGSYKLFHLKARREDQWLLNKES